VKGYTVAGIGEDGYPEYFGENNGEMCPEEEKGLVDGEIRCSWPKLDEIPFKWAPRKHKLEGTNYPIKRSHIVQRAIIWAANHWHKFGDEDEDESRQNTELGAAMSHIAECDKGRTCNLDGCAEGETAYCPRFFHGGACCATIGNAWNASTKNCWRGPRTSIRVPCDEMRPGDGISKGGGDKTTPDGHDFPRGSHVVVFRKWENPQKTFMTVFTNKRQTIMPRYDHMYCFKRKNIIEDIEPEFQEEIVMEEDEPETQEELVV